MFKLPGRVKTIIFLICILIIMFILIKDLMKKREQGVLHPSINTTTCYVIGSYPNDIYIL